MMNISTYNKTEIGYSHINKEIVCQDYSLSHSAPDGSLFVGIVSDGHGGKTYCRSNIGSRFACETALEAIKGLSGLSELLKDRSAKVPVRKKTNQLSSDNDIENFEIILPSIKDIDPVFEHLFQYIYNEWVLKVETHWTEHPPTKEEADLLGNNEIVKAYGATLLAFVQSNDYWFGFQIGDGKCLACNKNDGWYEPILWDSECFLNITTSLCGSDAYKSFRYSFSGKGDFPLAIMLGTDGIDDSWGNRLAEYYTSILEDIENLGIEKAKTSLSESLPDLSKNGSGDDVSISWIIDTEKIATVLPILKSSNNKTENENLTIQNKQPEIHLKGPVEERKLDKEEFASKTNSHLEKKKERNEKAELSNEKGIFSSVEEKLNQSESSSNVSEKTESLGALNVDGINLIPESHNNKNTTRTLFSNKFFFLIIGIFLGVAFTMGANYLLNKECQKELTDQNSPAEDNSGGINSRINDCGMFILFY
ncbi:MAG: protein phosphatase 2C domain-containing protein [Flavobacteriales bacterium]|nr:protein phosphatase 2C domain-containing protein [Flavobacteriales bacterium]